MSKQRLVVCCDGTCNKAETLTSIERLRLASSNSAGTS